MYGLNNAQSVGTVGYTWHKLDDLKKLPRDTPFMAWIPDDLPQCVACRVYETGEGELFVLYADELLCDVAPDPVKATHWSYYPKGPST